MVGVVSEPVAERVAGEQVDERVMSGQVERVVGEPVAERVAGEQEARVVGEQVDERDDEDDARGGQRRAIGARSMLTREESRALKRSRII